jgi:hypothetical protein
MITARQYINYLKDNPKGYWFKRKLFGWGWVPATWQGWIVILILVIYFVVCSELFLARDHPVEYAISILIGVLAVVIIGYLKGEKPRWQWGSESKNTHIRK